ncbi:MAG: flagellar filament outer layer protein FlaA, partial [Treponema sp.]|nr:flagellar filament outer layer protein FlaA [Treponema sp.]
MKKLLILVAIASLAVGSLSANEAVLIDFGLLTADMEVGDWGAQNRATLMDFSNVRFAGSFTEEQMMMMRTSLAIEKWEVDLAPSARTVTNQARSFTREAPSTRFGTVMGVRVHFPLEPFNSWAHIRPPFEIPAFEASADVQADGTITPNGDGNRFENGHGLVSNVATIKSLAVNVYGMNFPHSLWVVLIDQDGNRKTVPMGPLNFDGWSELRWDNPAYIQEVRNRELRITPIYPDNMPFVKFGGFEIRRDGSHVGGDFITYFRDVKI